MIWTGRPCLRGRTRWVPCRFEHPQSVDYARADPAHVPCWPCARADRGRGNLFLGASADRSRDRGARDARCRIAAHERLSPSNRSRSSRPAGGKRVVNLVDTRPHRSCLSPKGVCISARRLHLSPCVTVTIGCGIRAIRPKKARTRAGRGCCISSLCRRRPRCDSDASGFAPGAR